MGDEDHLPRTVPAVTRSPKNKPDAAKPPTQASRRFRRPRESVRVLGIEVDTNHVAAVLLEDGRATKTLTGRGATVLERLADVLREAGPTDYTRLALPLAGSAATPMTITADLASRRHFEAAAYRHTHAHPAATMVAGLFDLTGVTAGHTAPGLVLTAPRGPLEEIYQALADAAAAVTLPAAHSAPIEGLSLALRDEHAELTLVTAARVTAVEELPAGGLHVLDATLGQGNTIGATRLGAALTSTGADLARSDPATAEALSAYLRLVVSQAADAAHRWELTGHSVPSTIYVHGRGATAPHLPDLLTSAGLRRSSGNGLETALTLVNPSERPRLVSAYLAALAHDTASPTSTFANPAALASVQAAHRSAVRSHRTRTLALALVAATLTALAPALPAAVDAVSSTQDLTRRTQQAATTLAVPTADIEDYLSRPDEARDALDTEALRHFMDATTDAAVTTLSAQGPVIHATVNTTVPSAVLDSLTSQGFDITHSAHDTATATLTIQATIPQGQR